MLPRLPSRDAQKAVNFEVIAPPVIDTKGNITLQKLKKYCDHVYETNKNLVQELITRGNEIEKLKETIHNLMDDAKVKMNMVTDMRIRLTNENRLSRSQCETERLLIQETKIRIQQQEKVAKLETSLSLVKQEYQEYKERMAIEIKNIQNTDEKVLELTEKLKVLKSDLSDRDFEVDHLKVEIIHFQRVNDTLTKDNHDLTQQNESLTESSTILVQENQQLQKRIRELIDANKEVTTNYQIVKKNYDIKKQEADELALEVEDAKNACQLALKQKKTLQADLENTRKLKQEFEQKFKIAEETSIKREKMLQELEKKYEEAVRDYEGQLQRKEEQLWSMNNQLHEETSRAEKQRAALSAAQRKKEEAAAAAMRSTVDAEIITDIEKKWQKKEKQLLQELDDVTTLLRDKQRLINTLSSKITELEQDKYHPRMEYLEQIEKTMKGKLVDLLLCEEKVETGFICPRDLKPFRIPMTLLPCGHTFSKDSVDAMREENFNVLKCDVCRVEATGAYRNEQLERVQEQFTIRKEMCQKFTEW